MSNVVVNGTRVHYDVYGDGHGTEGPTVVLVHGWPIAPSASWKGQVPFLSRHYRVVTLDLPGNGQSDRPTDPAAYSGAALFGILDAVLDAAGGQEHILIGVSAGAVLSVAYAAMRPERVTGLVLMGAAIRLEDDPTDWVGFDLRRFNEEPASLDGWGIATRHGMHADYERFAHFFAEQVFCEPHTTKLVEDTVVWARGTGPEQLIAFIDGAGAAHPSAAARRGALREMCRSVQCKTLVIHGTDDRVVPYPAAVALADVMHAELLTVEGAGHVPSGRAPVLVNLAIRDFVDRVAPPCAPRRRTWVRPERRRRRRVLYLSSPIGLGHARRDLAIAAELRQRHPDAHIDWLAQPPVAGVLEAAGERVHPASTLLASEAQHFDDHAGEHDLHVFRAFRDADALLLQNFHVFNDVADAGDYDLVVGDEAWEVDYFLHENPELKRFAFAWLTDFVGFAPMDSGGSKEAALAAEYNAEMVEQAERFRRVRDRSLFVGDAEDVAPIAMGPSLPLLRPWVEEHFSFPGYVTGSRAIDDGDRAELRARLGYREDERVCVVAVGGSAAGLPLLRRIASAFPTAARKVDGLRMIAVAGPRIDHTLIGAPAGVDVRGYVPELWQHLAVCDVALVQGGLTTCMELVANRRPFAYFPLRNHFEQQVHVRHRLERYGAGNCLDYDATGPDEIASVIADSVGARVEYLPVTDDGAARAADQLAELL